MFFARKSPLQNGFCDRLPSMASNATATMAAPSTTLVPKPKTRPERPRLYKVILLNDDFTPRECVVAVFTFEIAEEKARKATDMGAKEGYPLQFTTERER